MSSTPLELPPALAVPPASSRRSLSRDLLVLVRPHQWLKNLLVVPLPLVAPAAWTAASVARLAVAVVVFTLASALVYIGNDIADRERDRSHPVKCGRPIAAGHVSVALAVALGCALTGVLAALLVLVAPRLAWPVAGYLVLNVLYSTWLKHVPLLDLFAVVLGFELRIVTGYRAVDVTPSTWLLLCVFFLCLMLILGKRRRELEDSGATHRPALAGYSPGLIDQMLTLSAGLTAVAFLFFLSRTPPASDFDDLATLLLTPLGLFGLFRYLQILAVHRAGGDPVRALLRDRVIVLTALLTAALLAALVVTGHVAGAGWLS